MKPPIRLVPIFFKELKMKIIKPIFAIILLVSPTIAFAQNGPKIDINRIKKADTNHDGKITEQEMRTYRNANFKQLDRNNDGFIDSNDVPQFAAARNLPALNQMITANDINHDGKLSRDEYTKGRLVVFDLFDANKDKVLDQAELKRAQEMPQVK